MKKIIYLVVIAATFSSCHIYKQYERPENIEVSDKYRANDSISAINTDTTTIASLTWEEVFPDNKLQELIRYGLDNNTDLLSAIEKVNEAKAALSASKLAFLPSLSMSNSGGVSSFTGSSPAWTYSLSVGASWEIDLFGRLMNAKRQSKVVMLQSLDYKQAVRTQLIATIAEYYYTLALLDKQLEIYTETAKNWKASVETMKAMKEGGMTNEAAVLQNAANYYMVAAYIPQIEGEIRKQENALSTLLGDAPRDIERNSLDALTTDFSVEVGVPIQLLSNRPDVKSAENNLAAMYYNTNISRSMFYPQITISGSGAWTNLIGEVIYNPAKFLFSALGSLTQPLFNRGTNIARLKIAKAQEEEARLAFQQSILNASREVSDALIAYSTENSKKGWRLAQVDALEKSVEYTTELMLLGTATYIEVLTAQQSLLDAQLSATSDKLTQLKSIIALYHAVGGGREVDEENDSSLSKKK